MKECLIRIIECLFDFSLTPYNPIFPLFQPGWLPHMRQPGFCWIVSLPDQTFSPPKVGPWVAKFTFAEEISYDNLLLIFP